SVAGGAGTYCTAGENSECDIQMFRVTAEGTLDPAFGDAGVLTLDLDDVPRPGLGELGSYEAIYELNARADGSEYLLGGDVSLAGNTASAPFAARISSSGQVLAARVIALEGTQLGS